MLKIKKGFSIIELLIVISILGILGSIAIPVYKSHVQEAKAAQGIQGLLSLKVSIMKCFQDKGSLIKCDDKTNGIPNKIGSGEINGVKDASVSNGIVFAHLDAIDLKTNKNIFIRIIPFIQKKQPLIKWVIKCSDYDSKTGETIVTGCTKSTKTLDKDELN